MTQENEDVNGFPFPKAIRSLKPGSTNQTIGKNA
jgi:hypothetical protein